MWNSKFYGLSQYEDEDSHEESKHMSRPPSSLSDRLDNFSVISVDDTDQQVSNKCVTVPYSANEGEEGIEHILDSTPWPGSWMEGSDDMKSENSNDEEASLFDVLESAKKNLPIKQKARSARSITLSLNGMPKALHEDKSDGNYDSSADDIGRRDGDDADTPDVHSVPLLSQSHGDPMAALPSSRRRKRWGSRRQDTNMSDITGASPLPQTAVKKKKKKKKVVNEVERKPMMLPHLQHKYKKPEKDKVRREYRQMWNEKGKLKKKNTEYLEIYYESYLPDEKEDIKYKPTHYTHNHKNGHHWEVRYLTQVEKPRPVLEKVDRVFENEYKIFQLNKLLDKQLTMKD